MTRDIVNTLLLAAAFLSLFAIAELLYYKFKIKAEVTRKIVHVTTGFITLLFPVMLGNQWYVLGLCATFALIIIASLQFGFLKSINAIGRKSHGSISYPFSVYGCYLIYDHYVHSSVYAFNPYIYFYLPVLTLAICDPVAAFFGKKFPYGKYKIGKDHKTLAGSISFFISSLLLTPVVWRILSQASFDLLSILPLVLLIAACSAISEAVSGKGVDNITIPATVVLFLCLFA